MRVSSYLAKCGLGSRRSVERIIKEGRLTLNGETVSDFSLDVTPQDILICDGKVLKLEETVYYLLYKPLGVTSTTSDKHAKNLITELVPKEPKVWPVGRLDRETEGLIILSNDGELTQRLTHPKYMKQKEYVVTLNKDLSQSEIDRIREGMILSDGFVRPDSIERTNDCVYKIVIHEGRNRLVRRIFLSLGKKVLKLKRIRIDTIDLGNLKPGEWRRLTDNEINKLRNV